jgi:hypothetical protein
MASGVHYTVRFAVLRVASMAAPSRPVVRAVRVLEIIFDNGTYSDIDSYSRYICYGVQIPGRISFRKPYYDLICIIIVTAKKFIPVYLVFERITLVDELAFRPRRVGTTQRACTSTSAYQFTKITPP